MEPRVGPTFLVDLPRSTHSSWGEPEREPLPDLIELIRHMMRVDEKPDDVYQEIDTCLIQLKFNRQ